MLWQATARRGSELTLPLALCTTAAHPRARTQGTNRRPRVWRQLELRGPGRIVAEQTSLSKLKRVAARKAEVHGPPARTRELRGTRSCFSSRGIAGGSQNSRRCRGGFRLEPRGQS